LKTLALIVPGLEQGGGVPAVARFLKDVARADGRFALRVVSLGMDRSDPDSARFRAPASLAQGPTTRTGTWEGLPYVHVGCLGAEFEFQQYQPRKALAEVLRECDLVQVVAGCPAWANAVLNLGKPVSLQVATLARVERRMRDARSTGPRGAWRRLMTRITARLDERALRRVDAVQVENPWMLDYVSRRAPRADVRYAPPGIDADFVTPSRESAPGAERYVLCVARLDDARKRLDVLLEAYALLPEALRSDCGLKLAGVTAPSAEFWRRAEALGLRDRVTYAGAPDKEGLRALYRRASVFALASDEEGLGVVLLEAMACGTPVVSTRSGGPDGIIEDGQDGFLTPLGDPAAFSAAIRAVLESPDGGEGMGAKGRAKVEARYSRQAAGGAFVALWEKLLGL
jgi:glycosyltransferase involved in cell wall biosynthesis